MRTRILALSLTIALSFVSMPVTAHAQGSAPALPFLGRWKLNPAKSDLQTTRFVFDGAASGDITMRAQGLTQTFRIDGKERPGVMGSMMTWTQTGPRSWKTVYRMAGVDNNIDQYTLSEDGKTLTMYTEFLVPVRSEQTMTFTRLSGGPGLMGTWQTRTLQGDASLEMTSTDGKRVSIYWLPFGGRALAPTDGTEVPVTGPPTIVAPGMTVSLKVTGLRTFDLAMKDKGTNLTSGRFTVAPGGKTMTVETIAGPPGPSQERSKAVFEKP